MWSAGPASRAPRACSSPASSPALHSSGLTEDGLPGPGGQTHQDFVLLTTAVEGGTALAGAAARQGVKQQMDAYESPRDRNGGGGQ